MKLIIATALLASTLAAFADGGTQAPALSGVTPQAASAAAKETADRRAARVAKRHARKAAKAASAASN